MHERVSCSIDPRLSCTPECPVFETAQAEYCALQDMNSDISPEDLWRYISLRFEFTHPIDIGYDRLNSAIMLENTCGKCLDECIRLEKGIDEKNT